MGPEPYTLLILCAQRLGKFAFKNFALDATDIDESGEFGSVIKEGRYPLEQVQRIPEDALNAYFTPDAAKQWYTVNDILREKIRFVKNDLLTLTPPGVGYAMVVCKNVLLHLTAEQRVEVIGMFYESLAENGILVLEQTQKMPDECAHLFTKAINDQPVYKKQVVAEAIAA
jgi:chemotaxis protein methyltransferase CheR